VTNSTDDITRTIDESARGLYFIAGTTALLALPAGYSLLLDAGAMAGLGLWLQRRQSKAAMIILFGLGAANVLIWVTNRLRITATGTGSPLIGSLMVWLALRAWLALRDARVANRQGLEGDAVEQPDAADEARASSAVRRGPRS
jgi:hypothetical protein